MNIAIDPKLFELLPGLKLGINYYTKITVSESPQMLKGRLQLYQEQLFFELEDKPFTEFEGVQEWRGVWKKLGADPNRYRPSAEALLRRIKKQQYLMPFHSAVDLNNFFSLQHSIPVGIYDANQLSGDISITVGVEDDGYIGLNGRFNSMKNILLLQDDIGSFGSPFVDSERTAIKENTTEAIQVFFLKPTMDVAESIELTAACGKMFTNISGGDSNTFVLHEEQPFIRIK